MYEYAVIIGRFQPFHNGHLSLLRYALKQAQHVIVIVGSDNHSRTINDPWTAAERISMIRGALGKRQPSDADVSFIAVKDYLYNDNLWIAEVQRAVRSLTGDSRSIGLVGHRRDNTSQYLALFPQWETIDPGPLENDISATMVRTLMFEHDKIGIKTLLPENVYEGTSAFMKTEEFERLHEEFNHIVQYKRMWAAAPFAPTFNTVDAIVVCSGHVLVVRRRCAPGKGLIALPGGFLNVNERIVDGCIRELKEETGIKLSVDSLKKSIVDEKVFDHPTRSLRGRTITHAFCLNLGRGELPVVKGMDDADKAWWMPFDSIHDNESMFFEDHYHIVSFFINRI